jgi:aminoglycoside phosphotransferase (APT) family kinase protein
MSRPPRFTANQVRQVACQALGSAVSLAEHLAVGWGNENWRVELNGHRFIMKIGPPESAPKWAATHAVYELGSSAGLPVPDLAYFERACAEMDGWAVRVFTWMDGMPPESALRGPSEITTFFGELAQLLRILHSLPARRFSSRLAGSAASFSRWSEYIAYRLPRVLERVRSTSCFSETEAGSIVATITALAAAVDATAKPAICHRDIYLDNLLANRQGGVAALLDFDGAEAWDPAIDVVKLRWLVFPRYPGSEEAFLNAYGDQPQWGLRVRLAELLELLNAVPNAVATGDAEFEQPARRRLRVVLSS